ncbi:MAG: potassium channel family protein [Actinomycetota bacterium]
MHVIIGGCGRVGAELGEWLSSGEHDVVIVDAGGERAFERLGSGFNGETVTGDVTDEEALRAAGIASADAFVAVTSLDNANLMSVQIARELYGVEHTVARLFNPQREASYRKMGVHYVSGTRLVAKAILGELHAGTFPQHVSFDEGDVEIVEMTVTRAGHGMTIAELERSGYVRVAAYQRGLRVRIAKLDDRVQEGDVLTAAARKGAHRKLGEAVANPLTAAAAGQRR